MKKILLYSFAILIGSLSVKAQTPKEIANKMNKREIIKKASRKAANAKIAKQVKKQVKQWKKEGWKTMPGQLSLEQQMQRSIPYREQYEDDNALLPKYVWGDATPIAQVYDAGKFQALELARQNLVGNIETYITKIIESNVGNDQTSKEQATSLIKTLNRAKSYMHSKLGQTITVMEAYRELPNGNVEVRVQICYSMDEARRVARDAIRNKMIDEGLEFTSEHANMMK